MHSYRLLQIQLHISSREIPDHPYLLCSGLQGGTCGQVLVRNPKTEPSNASAERVFSKMTWLTMDRRETTTPELLKVRPHNDLQRSSNYNEFLHTARTRPKSQRPGRTVVAENLGT